jgi:hypothetical protein
MFAYMIEVPRPFMTRLEQGIQKQGDYVSEYKCLPKAHILKVYFPACDAAGEVDPLGGGT